MRPHRILQNEYPYHVTTRTNGRQFRLQKETYQIFIAVFVEAVRRFDFQLQHFKLMDNHYHLKLCTPHENLSAIMQYINFQLALRINKLQGTSGHLWGARYHATIVERDTYEQRCVAYVYQNGVRVGLCKRASEDPRLSTLQFYTHGRCAPMVATPDDFYLALGGSAEERQSIFAAIIDEPISTNDLHVLQKSLRSPFYGSHRFIVQMRYRYAGCFGRAPPRRPV